jgi:hypothetical protein
MDNFSVFLNSYIGSFNYASKPYTDVSGVDLNEIKAYTDNGIAELFSDSDLSNLVGQLMYTDNSVNVTLPNQQNIITLNTQYTYFFPNGIINTFGSVYNGYDDKGYPLPGTKILFNIVGGSGFYTNVKGNVLLEGYENDLLKSTFYFEK